jgi:hypothetical protein
MSFTDDSIGFFINNPNILFGVIAAIILILIIYRHVKKISHEPICPFCKNSDTERIARNLFERLIHLNINSKKFKCLKCWKIYYLIEK